MKTFGRCEPSSGRTSLLLVLDSNEYLFAFGNVRLHACESLLDLLAESVPKHQIRVVRPIVDEVTAKFSLEQAKEFYSFLTLLTVIDERWAIPFDLGEKYLKVFKKGDAAIAAYTEFVGARALVSENRRHFHQHANHLPFTVWDAATCLKELNKAS